MRSVLILTVAVLLVTMIQARHTRKSNDVSKAKPDQSNDASKPKTNKHTSEEGGSAETDGHQGDHAGDTHSPADGDIDDAEVDETDDAPADNPGSIHSPTDDADAADGDHDDGMDKACKQYTSNIQCNKRESTQVTASFSLTMDVNKLKDVVNVLQEDDGSCEAKPKAKPNKTPKGNKSKKQRQGDKDHSGGNKRKHNTTDGAEEDTSAASENMKDVTSESNTKEQKPVGTDHSGGNNRKHDTTDGAEEDTSAANETMKDVTNGNKSKQQNTVDNDNNGTSESMDSKNKDSKNDATGQKEKSVVKKPKKK